MTDSTTPQVSKLQKKEDFGRTVITLLLVGGLAATGI
jgi:hypothetical protein